MRKIHFHATGEGRPVILIHGFCETHEIWDPFRTNLAGVEVISIDLPGFGQSHAFDSGSLEAIGKELNDWVLRSSFQRPVLVGHSLGGYVALAMVGLARQLYTGLCLFHSTAAPDTEERKVNRNKTMQFVKANGLQTFVDSFVPGLFHKKGSPYLAKTLALASKTTERTFFGYTEAMRDRPSRLDLLSILDLPVLILAGANDAILPVKSLEEQSRLNAQIDFQVLSDTGHMGMFEAETESAFVLNRFISGLK